VKDLSQVIKRPLITERGAALREQSRQYLFEVHPDANKHEIRQAVEHFFGVKVLDVRTLNRLGKRKRLGRFAGQRPSWKRAIVTLGPEDSIDLFDVV
jgi:large subunit ribosomal protein L23